MYGLNLLDWIVFKLDESMTNYSNKPLEILCATKDKEYWEMLVNKDRDRKIWYSISTLKTIIKYSYDKYL